MAELSKTARASMKGDKKAHVEEELTLERALKVIKGNLEAKLFTPTHFWEKVLEAYNELKVVADKSAQELLDAKEEIASLRIIVQNTVKEREEAYEGLADSGGFPPAPSTDVTHPDGAVAPMNAASE